MASFHYKAIDEKGDWIEGRLDAPNEAAVVTLLRRQQRMPVSIHASESAPKAGLGAGFLGALNQPLLQGRGFGRKDVAIMTRELATLLNAGLTVDQALNFLVDVATGDAQKKLFSDLLEKVQGGSTLADALETRGSLFSTAYTSLVRAGETGNALGDVLTRLAEFLDQNEKLAEQVKSALVYPLLLLVMAGLSIAVLLTLVVPQFTPIFESAGADLPWLTQIVVGMGEVTRAYWWHALIAIALLFFLGRHHLQDPAARLRLDGVLIKLPLIGDLIAKIDTAKLARTVGTLLANGVALPKALSITRNTMGNAALRETLDTALTGVKEGKNIAGALERSGMFPKLATHLVAVGERSGQLETMLLKIALIFDQEVKTAVERMMTLLVPMLTIGVGLVIATIIGAILSAILAAYQLPI